MAENNNKQPDKKKGSLFGNLGIILIALAFVAAIILVVNGCQNKNEEISYTKAVEIINANSTNTTKIDIVKVIPAKDSNPGESYTISIIMDDLKKSTYIADIPGSEVWNGFVQDCQANGVELDYTPGSTFNLWIVLELGGLIFSVIIIIVIISRANKGAGGMGSTMEFTKSRAKLSKVSTTKFKDVAGLDEEKEELKEVVDFLKNPQKYHDMGARIPKGVLLYGEPGTGKTLLARAVAGEAGVPFFYTTGSDLVEMFVGVGASRVRDMFKTAKKNAPSILFMDEIDAIGRQRGTGLGGGNDEREQTLNQLLVEMDGFGQNTNIIIIAATNRPDILDPALLRPGRFDRQINISSPDIKGREEILKVHARNKKVSSEVDFKQVAHQTPGFTGADLENVMNESALLAARGNKSAIDQQLISEAIDRVMMGPAKKSRVISQKEKEIVAYHEAGHCVIGTLLANAEVVQKVTIIPRGKAGGYNLMGPKDEEQYNYSKNQLLETITGLLGGLTAEELVFGEVTTGSTNDLQHSTSIARKMVTEFGMSKLGPIVYEQNSEYVFLGRDYSSNKNFSDTVAHEIDEEVRSIVNECHNNAAKVLTENMDKLKAIAHYLMVAETLIKSDIDEIFETGHLKRVDDTELKNLGTDIASKESEVAENTNTSDNNSNETQE